MPNHASSRYKPALKALYNPKKLELNCVRTLSVAFLIVIADSSLMYRWVRSWVPPVSVHRPMVMVIYSIGSNSEIMSQ